jgi:amino acid transporter
VRKPDPGRTIPLAVIGTVVVALVCYVFVSYAQVVGYGVEDATLLGQDARRGRLDFSELTEHWS